LGVDFFGGHDSFAELKSVWSDVLQLKLLYGVLQHCIHLACGEVLQADRHHVLNKVGPICSWLCYAVAVGYLW
jgi:hypothetical protein